MRKLGNILRSLGFHQMVTHLYSSLPNVDIRGFVDFYPYASLPILTKVPAKYRLKMLFVLIFVLIFIERLVIISICR